MNLANLSIQRPTFITCIVILMLAIGWISFKRLGVDLFPNVTFPVVTVNTVYPGAGPEEIETLVSKPIEDEVSSINGIKRLSSINQEGLSQVVAEFTLATDIKYAEQQVRDRVSAVRGKLPDDTEEPVIRRIDPSDLPVLTLSITAELPPSELYDLANEVIRPKLEQVPQVGLVEVIGGRKREIHVKLDREKLRSREVSASQVAARLRASGENIPVGKIDKAGTETVFRTVGQFSSIKDISSTIVNFLGNDIPTTISDVGTVEDTLQDEKTRTFVNKKQSLFLNIYKQSGSNTVAVVEGLKTRMGQVNNEYKDSKIKAELSVVRDGSLWIKANVDDVKETIIIGIALAIFVVFFFLGSGRSTLITGLALPNSLIGAFILMALAGFTINIMTLLALSLSVGLLIDDAIVVRENIFRHIEMGKSPVRAAAEGTAEVRLAVIATTLAVIAVFGPVGFIPGIIGQFLREFGLTMCFAMLISLFDALTMAPMLSAYFAGKVEHLHERKGLIAKMLQGFDRFQTKLENKYEKIVATTLRRPLATLGIAFMISLASCIGGGAATPKTFLPAQDAGEFTVSLDMPPGTSLDKMTEVAQKIDDLLHADKTVELTGVTVGGRNGEANVTDIYVRLVPSKKRPGVNTSMMKDKFREELKAFPEANPIVKDFDAVGGGIRPFNLNILGNDMKVLDEYTQKLAAYMRTSKALKDVDTNYRSGKPEFQIVPNKQRMETLGISSVGLGQELRAQIEGVEAAKFREKGVEYDIRVRLQENQRDLQQNYAKTAIPNINGRLIRLADVSAPLETKGPTKINRMNRNRYIQINADIAPNADLEGLMSDLKKKFVNDPELKLPPGTTFAFVGQAEDFQEMNSGMMMAMGLGTLFIFLVLASLYESFITPITIMLAMPLAIAGSFVALAVTRESLNIFSMIGMVMLMGVSAKNSILLVDFANHLVREGKSRTEAMITAGRTRLRPILMTTMALIAGMIPLAIGLNEASKQRTSMGVGIIGGLISSTILTLVVVPAAWMYLDRFRVWSNLFVKKLVGATDTSTLTEDLKRIENGEKFPEFVENGHHAASAPKGP